MNSSAYTIEIQFWEFRNCHWLGTKNSYKTIHTVYACFMFKKSQLPKISHIFEGLVQMMWMRDFLISLWLGFRKSSPVFERVNTKKNTKIFHLTRTFRSINFCLNFTYLILYFDSNLTFICRQSIMLFYCSQEAQSVNSS